MAEMQSKRGQAEPKTAKAAGIAAAVAVAVELCLREIEERETKAESRWAGGSRAMMLRPWFRKGAPESWGTKTGWGAPGVDWRSSLRQ